MRIFNEIYILGNKLRLKAHLSCNLLYSEGCPRYGGGGGGGGGVSCNQIPVPSSFFDNNSNKKKTTGIFADSVKSNYLLF